MQINAQLIVWHKFSRNKLSLLSWTIFVACFPVEGLSGVVMSGLSCLFFAAYAQINAPEFSLPLKVLRSKLEMTQRERVILDRAEYDNFGLHKFYFVYVSVSAPFLLFYFKLTLLY